MHRLRINNAELKRAGAAKKKNGKQDTGKEVGKRLSALKCGNHKGRMNLAPSPEDIRGCGQLGNLECSPGGQIEDHAMRSI